MSKPSRRSARSADSYRRRKPDTLIPPRPQPAPATAPAAELAAPEQARRVDYLVQLGIEAYRSRRLEVADGYLSQAVSLAPGHSLALNCLGMVHRARGDTAQAISCYERALRHAPDYAEAHNNLGVAQETRGANSAAAEAYTAALRHRPNFVAALTNLGSVLTKLGRPTEAVERLQQAIRERPTSAAAHNNLGLAHARLQRWGEAEQCYRRALALQPQFPEACVNLGNALRARSRTQLPAAEECFRTALQLRPRFPAAWNGLGNVQRDLQQWPQALASYDHALLDDPQLAEAHFGRGTVMLEQHRWPDAEAAFRRALDCDPEYAEAWNNLGSTYQAWGRMDQAEAAFRQAVTANPDLAAAHNNLGNLYRLQDRCDLAAAAYREVLNRQSSLPLPELRLSTLCPTVFDSRTQMDDYLDRVAEEWRSLRGACTYRNLSDLLHAANEVPYNLQFFASNIRPWKEAYAAIFRYDGPMAPLPPPAEKIRIGCVVTAGHEIAFLRLVWEALHRMNRDEFCLCIFCAAGAMGKFRTAIHDEAISVIELPEATPDVGDVIQQQHCDVLYYFEIGTDARNYFLPFLRLAPIQVTSWGIQVTSGIPAVDCYLSSELVEPPDADEHYSERLLRARTLLTYQRRLTLPTAPRSRESLGFSASDHLYLCAQHLGKFHPDFDVVLAEILRRDKRGIVVGTEDRHGFGAQRLRERWSRVAPDVASRMVLLPRLSQPEYLSLLAAGDVMLDPLHFGGVSTTYDGLSLAKPMVTLPSRYHRGRYTAGCFARMALTTGVARDVEDYVRLAVSFGTDSELRATVSRQISEHSDRIFEDHEAVTEHERLFRTLAHEGSRT